MKTMKTKKPKASEFYKAPCDGLDKILNVKKLNEKDLNKLISILRKYVKTSKPGKNNVIQYVKTVVFGTLSEEEQILIAEVIKGFDIKLPENVVVIQNLLASIYNAITEIYPILRIENICADVNGFVDPGAVSDQEFDKIVTKQTEKKKATTGELTTLKAINDLESSLNKNIVGQSEAVKTVCEALKLKAAGFSNFVTLFFIGKTGRGKSELAKLLGKQYSGNFWVINCAEFAQGHEINKLLGAPPGYIGHSDKSLLKEKSEKSNKWVILFDEIEKASDRLFNFLLALLDTGKCQDNIGTNLDFSNSIFIFTSNCGMKDLKSKSTNFHLNQSKEADKEDIMKSLQDQFSPEFRNRVDEFVFFNDLTRDDAKKIAELNLKSYPIKRTPELIDYVVKNGFSEEFGAREIRRFIKKNLGIPLADAVLSGKKPQDGTVQYEPLVAKDKIEIINTSTL